MNIAIYLDATKHGGVDTHLIQMLQNWPNDEDSITIISNRNNEGLKRLFLQLNRITHLKIKYYSNLHVNKFRIFFYLFEPIKFLIQILRGCYLLRSNGKFDVLLSDNGGFPGASSCLAIIISAFLLKIPKRLLLIHHAASPQIPILTFWNSLRDMALQYCATDLVTVSLATRKTLVERRYFKTMNYPIHVIPNGISIQKDVGMGKINFREIYHIAQDEYIIGMISRVERYKGQEDLIIAMSRLPKEYREKFKVIIVGSGDSLEFSRLKVLAKKYKLEDKIIFTGFIEDNPTQIISDFDLLLMLTKDFEAFNYTIAEAMIMNVPTIITQVGAIKEYYNPKIAKIVPPESPDLIAEALIEFAMNPSSYYGMAARAKEHIKKFNAERMAYNFHDLMM